MTEPVGRSYPLRTLLQLLMLVSMLPTLVLAALMVRNAADENRANIQRRVLESARDLAGDLEERLLVGTRTLSALAESDLLTRGDLEGFRSEAARHQSVNPEWLRVLLTSPQGHHLFSTGVSGQEAGQEALPEVSDGGSLLEVVEKRQPVVGHLRPGPNGRLAFALRVPVVRDGAVTAVLSAVITPQGLTDALKMASGSDEWVRVLVNGDNVIVARTREPQEFVGLAASPEFLARIGSLEEGVVDSTTLEGALVYSAISRNRATGWMAVVAVPRSVVEAQFFQSLTLLGIVGALLLGVGGLGSYFIARWIGRDISMVSEAAAGLVEGRPLSMSQPRVDEVRRLADALEHSAALIKTREQERDERVSRADAARAEAEATTRARDEFLAMLGHELRNPLAPVLNALHLARAQDGVIGPRERDVIERQVRHMARLVDDLLDVSRLRRGAVALREEMVDLRAVADEALEMTRPLFEDNDQHLSIAIPTGLQLMGDDDRIAQVLTNLLSNAAKYTPRGGMVSLSAREDGHDILIQCADNGIGIGADLLPHLFDPFVQGARSIDRRQGGLGLGLAVARTLVELHGGTISVRSDGPGLGSVFDVRFPTRLAVSTEPPAPRPVLATSRPAIRVLVVEDHDDVRDMLVRVLTMGGVETRGVGTASAAMRVVVDWQPAVAVLDIGLPDMDGFELARALRARDLGRTLHLVALTGYGGETYAEEARAAGFDEFLVKPLGVDALLEMVGDLQKGA
jgi:signal transduction histidine kinase/ActR/RegA family two-component response regulator